jgi:hypothetical protein
VRTFVGATNECAKELLDRVGISVFPDAVLPSQRLKPTLIQEWSNLIEEKLQIPFQQTHRNGCADCTQDADPGRFLAMASSFTSLLLLCLPFPILSIGMFHRMVNGADGIAANLAKLTLLVALRDNGFRW